MSKILFQLTPEIIDMIIFGMENQSDEYYVDIKTGDVLSETQAEENFEDEYIDSYIVSVPDWLPSDGFQLMESFVATLHNPVYKEVLSKILSAGKGAFRNFKNTVKEHESLTQQWYLHKEKVMRSRVIEWYNQNSEILKYMDINENTDDTDNLILSDFVFLEGDSKWQHVFPEIYSEAVHESFPESDSFYTDYIISRNKYFANLPGNTPLLICAETINGEFAGFISGYIINPDFSGSSFAVANAVWVEKIYRGLGLAKSLIDQYFVLALKNNAANLIFELADTKSILNSTLEERKLSVFLTTRVVTL